MLYVIAIKPSCSVVSSHDAIAEELKLPVRFLGVGEKMEDLVSFDAESFAAALFSKN